MKIVTLLNRVIGNNGRLLKKANEYMYCCSGLVMYEEEELSFSNFFQSIFYLTIIVMISSTTVSTYIIEPFMRDGSIHIRPRFTINQEALDTIAEDQSSSVIAFGSSMMFKGLDGGCVSQNLNSDTYVYNLAQVGSRPYTDMSHIPRTISANPELVLIEIGPNLLTDPKTQRDLDYIQLRFNLDSMYQSSEDIGEWLDLIHPDHENWVATNEFKRVNLRQEYIPKAIEERILNIMMNETFRHPGWISSGKYDWVPAVDSEDWFEYLQTPNFPYDNWGFDGMTSEQRYEYNETKMSGASAYYPINNSLSNKALDYTINTLIQNGIKVMIVVPPQHPLSLESVRDSQWDALNETIDSYLVLEGVSLFNQLWEEGWSDVHFFDRNHLDDEGRVEFCSRVAPFIDQVLSE